MRNALIAALLFPLITGVAHADSSGQSTATGTKDNQQTGLTPEQAPPPSLGPAGPTDVYYKESPYGSPAINNRLFDEFVKGVKYKFGGYARFRYAHNPVAATVPAAVCKPAR